MPDDLPTVNQQNDNQIGTTTSSVKSYADLIKDVDKLFKDNHLIYPKIKVAELREDGFEKWYTSLKLELSIYGLDVLLDQIPADQQTDLVKMYSLKVSKIILLNVDDKLKVMYENEQNAYDLMKKLKEQFQGNKQVQCMKMFGKIFELISNKNEFDIEYLISTIRTIKDKFESVQDKDAIWKAVFINALPNGLGHLKQNLCTLDNAELSRYFDIALQSKHLINKNHNERKMMSNNIKNSNGIDDGCWECGNKNHVRKDCLKYLKRINKRMSANNNFKNQHNNQQTNQEFNNQRASSNNDNKFNKFNNANSNNNHNFNRNASGNYQNDRSQNANWSKDNRTNQKDGKNYKSNNHISSRNVNESNDEDENGQTSRRLFNGTLIKRECVNYIDTVQDDPNRYKYFIDSGATDHMINNKIDVDNFKKCDTKIYTASNDEFEIDGIGDKIIKTTTNYDLKLNECIICPELSANFLSVAKLDKNGCECVIKDGVFQVKFQNEIILVAHLNEENLYEVQIYDNELVNEERLNVIVHRKNNDDNILNWHRTLGHASIHDLKIIQNRLDINISDDTKLECVKCIKSKITKLPFHRKEIKSTNILQLIHTDLSGIIRIPNKQQYKYFVLYIDDFSRCTFIQLLRSKTEVAESFDEFKILIENQMNCKIKKVKSDGGTEYTNSKFNSICTKGGIKQMLTAPNCPSSNGTSERNNRTIEQFSRCLLLESDLGISFWPWAVMYAVYLRNRMPHSSLNGKIPFEVFYGEKVRYDKIQRFGSRVIYLEDEFDTNSELNRKFSSRGQDGVFLGIPFNQDGYYIYSLYKRKVCVKRHVQFVNEDQNQFKNNEFNSKDQDEREILETTLFNYDEEQDNCQEQIDLNEQLSLCDDDNDILFMREDELSKTNNDKATDHNKQTVGDCDNQSQHIDEFVSADEDVAGPDKPDPTYPDIGERFVFDKSTKEEFLRKFPKAELGYIAPVRGTKGGRYEVKKYVNAIKVPRTFRQIDQCDESKKWNQAINDELQAMTNNKVWQIVDRPVNKQIIPLNWLFKIKYNSDGSIDKYKARLVVLGNLQKSKSKNTYAPVLNEVSFRTLLSYGVRNKMYIEHMDVCTAYLNADIEEEIYVEMPQGMNKEEGKVLRLLKSLYGLRGSACNWYRTISGILFGFDFRKSSTDHCVFYRNVNGKSILIGIYVDDILIMSTDIQLLNKVKCQIDSKVTLSDRGTISNFLGLNIKYDRETGTMSIDQIDFIKQLIDNFGLNDAFAKKTPAATRSDLFSTDGIELENATQYMSMVGRLIYLSTHSRPDITYVVNRLCSFMSKPTVNHLNAAKHLIKYIKYTINYSLNYDCNGKNELILSCDADFANCKTTSKSISGNVLQLFGNTIEWFSRKQTNVSTSTCEAEIVAIYEGINSMCFVRNMLCEFSNIMDLKCRLLNDNTSAIATCVNSGDFSKNKHYRVKINYIQDIINQNWLTINHQPSTEMVADFLTKVLTSNQLIELLKIVKLY